MSEQVISDMIVGPVTVWSASDEAVCDESLFRPINGVPLQWGLQANRLVCSLYSELSSRMRTWFPREEACGRATSRGRRGARADRRNELRALDEAGDPVHGADGVAAVGSPPGDVRSVRSGSCGVGQARGGDEDREAPPGAAVTSGAGGVDRRPEGEPRCAGVLGHASGGDDGQRGDDAGAAQRGNRGVGPRVPVKLPRFRRGADPHAILRPGRRGAAMPPPTPGPPHAVMEAALAQTIRSKVEAAYARRIRRPSRSTRSLTTVSPPRPRLRTATSVVSLVQCRVGATGRSPLRRPGCTRRPACPVTPPIDPTYGYRNGYIRHWTSDMTLGGRRPRARRDRPRRSRTTAPTGVKTGRLGHRFGLSGVDASVLRPPREAC